MSGELYSFKLYKITSKENRLLLLQRNRQSNPVNRLTIRNASILAVLAHNQILVVGINKQTNEIGAHIMAAL